MNYFAFILACVSCYLSMKALKMNKQARASAQPECKNAVNQRVVNSIKDSDKKGKQIIYAAVKFDGDELEHVLVNLQDLSVISATENNPGT